MALVLGAGCASPPSPRRAADAARLQEQALRIDSELSELDSTSRILLGISAEGASVVAYREDRQVRKISVEALWETGKELTDYYFKGSELFLAHARSIGYGGNIVEELEGKELEETVREEDRYYFSNGKLLAWISGDEPVPSEAQEYRATGQSVLAEAKSLLRFVETPPPAGGEDGCDWTCVRSRGGHCVEYACTAP